MSAEPPDSSGMGWAWKCLSMSDTVWNHRWWTWHWPLSFTDRRRCCVGKRRRKGEKQGTRWERGQEERRKGGREQGREGGKEVRGTEGVRNAEGPRKRQQLTLPAARGHVA